VDIRKVRNHSKESEPVFYDYSAADDDNYIAFVRIKPRTRFPYICYVAVEGIVRLLCLGV
jgi:hypothetical protein